MMKLLLIALGVALGMLIAPLIWTGIFWFLATTAEQDPDADRDPF